MNEGFGGVIDDCDIAGSGGVATIPFVAVIVGSADTLGPAPLSKRVAGELQVSE